MLLLAALVALLGMAPQQRVIVQVDHLQIIEGTVLLQDEDGLHIRTRQGEDVLVNPHTAFHVVLLLDVDQPEPVVVHMRDGRRIRGLLHADDWDAVRVDVHGVRLKLSRSDVGFVQRAPDIEGLYRTSRASIDDADEAGRMALARWLIDQKAWALAEVELLSLVETFDNIEAAKLLPRARAHAAAAAAPNPIPAAVEPAPATDPNAKPAVAPAAEPPAEPAAEPPAKPQTKPPVPPPNAGMPPLPTPEIVHLLQVLELDPTNPPPLKVTTQTRERLHLGWSGSRLLPDTPEALEHLLAMSDPQALQLMFDLRARPLYGDVQVEAPPPAVAVFNSKIHDGWLTTRCGTRTCHGGPDAGRFRLYRSTRPDDRVRTANLLLLQTIEVDGQPLLDWATPANSLLVQHALPRTMADQPHPRTPGWRPVLNGDRLETMLRWMRSMRTPRPTLPWPPEPPLDDTPPTSPPIPPVPADPA